MTLATMSATVTTGKRSVGMLSLSGNTRRRRRLQRVPDQARQRDEREGDEHAVARAQAAAGDRAHLAAAAMARLAGDPGDRRVGDRPGPLVDLAQRLDEL